MTVLLQEQHITQSEIVKLKYVLYEGAIQETTHCTVKGNTCLVCSSALRRTAFICMLIRSKKSLTEHVQYHYETDQYSAIC